MAKFTLQQIFAALAASGENGPQMIADVQEELGNLRTEAGGHRTAKQKVFQALGIQEGADVDTALTGIASSIAALNKTGGKPDEIGRQLSDLANQVKTLTEQSQANADKAAQERDKRIGTSKLNAALAALQTGKASNPSEIAKIVLANIHAKDDDTLIFKDGDKEIGVEDGVKTWLAANPWAVSNTQKPGSGSGSGAGGGAGRKYTKAEMEAMTPDQINADWENVSASLADIQA